VPGCGGGGCSIFAGWYRQLRQLVHRDRIPCVRSRQVPPSRANQVFVYSIAILIALCQHPRSLREMLFLHRVQLLHRRCNLAPRQLPGIGTFELGSSVRYSSALLSLKCNVALHIHQSRLDCRFVVSALRPLLIQRQRLLHVARHTAAIQIVISQRLLRRVILIAE